MAKTDFQLRILGSVAFVAAVMGLGSALTALGLASWYQTLVLPSYAPPGSVIGLVWTTIFALLSVAILLSWNKADKEFWKGIGPLYIVNGLLNVLWSFVFFYMHDLMGAAVTAGLLACSVLIIMIANLGLSKVAALLLLPYFLWTSFATGLNVHIAILNKTPKSEVVVPAATAPATPSTDPVVEVPTPTAPNTTFTFGVGATKKIDSHLKLTLNVINDSRCPDVEGVQCIWAGELSPEFTAVVDGKASTVRLGTVTAKTAEIGNYTLTIVTVGLDSAKITVVHK